MAERKTVTVVDCDLVDSTGLASRLDSETFGSVIARFHDAAGRAMSRHEGTMLQYPGDAVVAVFGIPDLHEDDALRAVTAAFELRLGSAELNVELTRTRNVRLDLRMGIDTGEVVVDERAGVLGDPVNVAARLQQVAGAGEILVGQRTREHVHRVTTLQQVPGLLLKGKELPVNAWRLLAVVPDPHKRGRYFDAPMVGRDRELKLLRSIYDRAADEKTFQLTVVLGEPGVGKTRLVNEFEEQISQEATVLKGRCPQYGENVDFWPFLQVVRQAAGIRADDSSESAAARLSSLVPDDESIAIRLAQMLGLREGTGSPETASWAAGRLVEMLAASQPLIVTIDDLQWAKPALLDFLGEVAMHCRESPVLLISMARPEFRQERSAWIGGMPNAMSLTLNSLGGDQIEQLIGYLLDGGSLDADLGRQLADAALGYPLFAEELVAMLQDQGALELREGRWHLEKGSPELPTPPNIEALLAARLDLLGSDERAVIGKAAVVGPRFRAPEVAALASLHPAVEELAIPEILRALARKELLRPDPSASPNADGYQFRHVLVHDAAYRSASKETRADLHEQFAGWLEATLGAQPVEIDERMARHLTATCKLRAELGQPEDATADLRRRAGEWLASAGLRAARRGDAPDTAARLLRDAVELLPVGESGRQAQLHLADTLSERTLVRRGRSPVELHEVTERYNTAIDAARSAGDRSVELHAALGRLEVAWFHDLGSLLNPGVVEEATQQFEWLRDEAGLARAWRVQAYIHAATGRSTAARRAAEHAIRMAQRARDVRWEARSRQLRCFFLDWGPTPVDEVAQHASETLAWAERQGIRSTERGVRNVLARAEAMRGDFGAARKHIERRDQIGPSTSEPLLAVADAMTDASVDLLEDRPTDAERTLRQAYSTLKEAEGHGPLANVAAMLARALLVEGRDDEAERLAEECAGIAPESQRDAQIKHREIRALVLARRAASQGGPDAGALAEEAQTLAREAVALSEQSEQLDSRAQALYDLAEVLGRAGRWDEAEEAVERARELWLRKGNLVSADKAPKLLEELRQGGSAG